MTHAFNNRLLKLGVFSSTSSPPPRRPRATSLESATAMSETVNDTSTVIETVAIPSGKGDRVVTDPAPIIDAALLYYFEGDTSSEESLLSCSPMSVASPVDIPMCGSEIQQTPQVDLEQTQEQGEDWDFWGDVICQDGSAEHESSPLTELDTTDLCADMVVEHEEFYSSGQSSMDSCSPRDTGESSHIDDDVKYEVFFLPGVTGVSRDLCVFGKLQDLNIGRKGDIEGYVITDGRIELELENHIVECSVEELARKNIEAMESQARYCKANKPITITAYSGDNLVAIEMYYQLRKKNFQDIKVVFLDPPERNIFADRNKVEELNQIIYNTVLNIIKNLDDYKADYECLNNAKNRQKLLMQFANDPDELLSNFNSRFKNNIFVTLALEKIRAYREYEYKNEKRIDSILRQNISDFHYVFATRDEHEIEAATFADTHAKNSYSLLNHRFNNELSIRNYPTLAQNTEQYPHEGHFNLLSSQAPAIFHNIIKKLVKRAGGSATNNEEPTLPSDLHPKRHCNDDARRCIGTVDERHSNFGLDTDGIATRTRSLPLLTSTRSNNDSSHQQIIGAGDRYVHERAYSTLSFNRVSRTQARGSSEATTVEPYYDQGTKLVV